MDKSNVNPKAIKTIKIIILIGVASALVAFFIYQTFFLDDSQDSENVVVTNGDSNYVSPEVQDEIDKANTKNIVNQFDDEDKIKVEEGKSTEEHYVDLHGEKIYEQAKKYAKKYAEITGNYNGDNPTQYFIEAKDYMTEDHLTYMTSVPPRPTEQMQMTSPVDVKLSPPEYLEDTYLNDYQIVFEVYKTLDVVDSDGNSKEEEEQLLIIMEHENGEWKVGEVM